VIARVGEVVMECVESSVGCDDAPGGLTGGWGTGGVSYRQSEPSSGLARSPDQNYHRRLHHALRLHYRLD
jgi:hypothetical protein